MALLRTVHAWTGAILSLLLVVIGLSGAVLVFREDAVRLAAPVASSPETLGGALEAIERNHPGAARILLAASNGSSPHRLYRADGAGYVTQAGEDFQPGAGRWIDVVAGLHRNLLVGPTGRLVVGLAGVAAVLLILSGLVVWAPAWRAFRLRLWPASAQRRDLVSTHRDLGALMALPLFLFCATGVTASFSEQTGKVLAKALPQVSVPPPPELQAGPGDIDWPRTLAAVHARFPDGAVRMIQWPGEPGAPAVIRLSQPGEWASSDFALVLVDPGTSRILFAGPSESVPRGASVQASLDALHAAAVGGRAYDALAVLSGLTLAALGVLGLWSFLIKPRRRVSKAMS